MARLLRGVAALALVLCAAGPVEHPGPAPPPCQYEATLIYGLDCPIFGLMPVQLTGINEHGHVCGYRTRCNGNYEAFIWTPETGLTIIPRPAGIDWMRAYDLNDAGWVVGSMWNDQVTTRRPFLYDGSSVQELPTISGGNGGEAYAINGSNQIAGWSGNTGTGLIHAALWEAGAVADLGPMLGSGISHANDIMDDSTIVGWVKQPLRADKTAFILDESGVALLGPIPGGFQSEGEAINSSGMVVGSGLMQTTSTAIARHAFRWQDGAMVDLGTLPGFENSSARDVNDSGVIVGECWGVGAGNRGVIWIGDSIHPLEDLLAVGTEGPVCTAWSINERGEIVGTTGPNNTAPVGMVLSPVPVLIGDLDCSGQVGIVDLLHLLAAWGPCPNCPEDLDDDEQVTVIDLLTLLKNWS